MSRIRITYRPETADTPAKPADELKLGAWAQVMAKRRYGLDVAKSGDPEPVLFGAFIELCPRAPLTGFDDWLKTIDDFGLVEEDPDETDPTPAETSSPPWHESPPTSA